LGKQGEGQQLEIKNDTGMWRNVPVYTSINTKGTAEKFERRKEKKTIGRLLYNVQCISDRWVKNITATHGERERVAGDLLYSRSLDPQTTTTAAACGFTQCCSPFSFSSFPSSFSIIITMDKIQRPIKTL